LSVWFAIPSARPVDEARRCFNAWKNIGCYLAATRKDPEDGMRLNLDLCVSLPIYPGWPSAINHLAKEVLALDPDCAIVATGGDDCFPDPDFPAAQMEREFIKHFGGTLGVCQPTGGKPWSKGIIDGMRVQERLAWAPWLGREYCQRGYGGIGPFWPDYGHFHADEELFNTAQMLGIWWARPEVREEHMNWKVVTNERPTFLDRAQQGWDHDQAMFRARKAAGFPGHELA
jgi:hypothetical protein